MMITPFSGRFTLITEETEQVEVSWSGSHVLLTNWKALISLSWNGSMKYKMNANGLDDCSFQQKIHAYNRKALEAKESWIGSHVLLTNWKASISLNRNGSIKHKMKASGIAAATRIERGASNSLGRIGWHKEVEKKKKRDKEINWKSWNDNWKRSLVGELFTCNKVKQRK